LWRARRPTYQTKPEIGLDLLQATVKRNEHLEQPLPFEWVAAYGL
jgi:hypothetical protein